MLFSLKFHSVKILVFSLLTITIFTVNTQAKSSKHLKAVKQDNKKSWEHICKQSKDAVVQIFAHLAIPNLLEPYKTPDEQITCGTGFFIDEQGYGLTNFHVIAHAKKLHIQIPSLGKERFEIEVIGGNPQRDVALFKLTDDALKEITSKLPHQTLTYLEFGNSDNLTEAQEIMVMGYPLGQENIKIALGNISGSESSDQFLGECKQTTAAVNPGNSGGPFLDQCGKIIGVCVAKIVRVDAEGIGYLIPINNVKIILKDLFTTKIGKIPYWGFNLTVPTNEHTLNFLGNPSDGGVYVSQVKKGSITESAGLMQGDVIYAINDEKLDRFGFMQVPWNQTKISLHDYLSRLAIGDTCTFTLYRRGEKKEISVQVTCDNLFKINDYYPWYDEPIKYEIFGGLVVVELTLNHVDLFKKIAHYLTQQGHTDIDAFSLLKYEQTNHRFQPRLAVVHIIPTTQAYRTSFGYSDRIIKKVNDVEVFTIDDFRNAILLSKGKEYVTVEAEGGSFCAFSLEEIFEKEDMLADCFGYPKSSLLNDLALS